jgi:predicted flap endonuclease-1-like 5' DNA nuclease
MLYHFIIPPKFIWFQDNQSLFLSAWIWGAILLVLVIVFFSWLAARGRKKKEEQLLEIAEQNPEFSGAIPQTGAPSTTGLEPPEAVIEEPVLAEINHSHLESLEHDDFTVLEGIGPAMAEILVEAGITTYDKLSQADPAILKDLLVDVGLQYVDPSDWPEQARLASKDRWDELNQMKRRIRGELS